MSEKWGLSHTNQEKSGQSYLFLLKKKGLIIYLAALIKGAIQHAHPYYAIYINAPSPPPPPHTHTLPPPSLSQPKSRV